VIEEGLIMPLYRFNVVAGTDFIFDEAGIEIASDEVATAEALSAIREVGQEEPYLDSMEWRLEIVETKSGRKRHLTAALHFG
jgi:hypothetical protein